AATRRISLLLFAFGVELLEIGPEVGDLLLVLDAREGHAGAGDALHRVLDVFLERRLVPGDARVLVGIGVVEARKAGGVTAVDPVKRGAELDLRAFAGVVT